VVMVVGPPPLPHALDNFEHNVCTGSSLTAATAIMAKLALS
jgi:hypothetical protein